MPDIEHHISEVDKTLSMLRQTWMEAKFDDKPKWLKRINAALETRLVFMKLRDGMAAQSIP